jgi:hypothetical protein
VRALLGFYLALTRALGSQRRLIRRVAALCLVFMGVHMAADHLDDVAYTVIDAIDLAVDNTVTGFLDWLAQAGGISSEAALKASAAFASFVDLPEKDKLSLALSLFSELLLDVLLIGLAWGRYADDDEPAGMLGELKASAAQMKSALSPLDLERIAVIPTLFAYALGGALTAALAVEGIVRDLEQHLAPDFLWASHAAAAAGILAAALLVWRFFPDLLHGALLSSRARYDRARQKMDERLQKPHRFPRVAMIRARVNLHGRGIWLLLLALPLALAGLASHDLLSLVARIEVVP